MSDSVEFTPAARWKHLRDNGPKLLVDLTSNDLIGDKPDWLDEDRFAKAKATICKYYLGVAYSSFTGLLLILQLPDGLEPLLVTGNSKDIPALYRRYLSTVLHVQSWYEDDIFNPETKGYKSIRQVRSMHRRVQQLMNEKYRVSDLKDQPKLWMTQYDVALTQFAFIGLAMLFPKKSAMIAASREEFEHINYYWRVLGWLLGMKDEFNACQFDKYEDIREFNRLMLEEGYLGRYKEEGPCDKGLEMTKAICIAMHYFTPLITFNSLAYWWRDCFQFNGYTQEPLTIKEKVLNMWTKLSFNQLLKHKAFLNYSTKLQKKRFEARLKKRDKVYESLKEQYQGKKEMTFFSDRVDYFDKNAAATNSAAEPSQEKIKTEDANKNAGDDNNDTNNNNDNSIQERDEISEAKAANLAQNTIFRGCPFGYDAILPALAEDNQQTVAV